MLSVALLGWICAYTGITTELSTVMVAHFLGLLILTIAVLSLQATAEGDLDFPTSHRPISIPTIISVIQHYLLFLAAGLGGTLAFLEVGTAAGVGFLIIGVIILPAVIISITIANNSIQSLSPIRLAGIAGRMGGAYLLLVLLVILFMGTPGIIAHVALEHLPAKLHLLLYGLLQSYFTLVAYHLVGYVIYQYHDRIGREGGHSGSFEPSAALQPNNSLPWSRNILQRVDLMIEAGKLDGAIAVIQNATAKEKFDDLELSQRYLDLLKMSRHKDALERHAPRHLWLLIKAGRKEEACRLYQELIDKDPEFSPHPAQLFELAGWLVEREPPQMALFTFTRLVRTHPNDPLVPKAYFRIAQILYDRFKDPIQAKSILKCLMNRYPEHEIIPKVKNYLINI